LNIDVSFLGGVAIEANLEGQSVRTDHPAPLGGGTAATPFNLFLASIATCMSFYALRFCQERGIPTEGLGFSFDVEQDEPKKRVLAFRAALALPAGFPEKYRDAIRRAVDQCTVKRHLLEPPAFELTVS
jgi:ribosomal protein S12 methylthiotransferase accessory factor